MLYVKTTYESRIHTLKSLMATGMQAHQHAANADDYLAQGLLIPAAEEHYKAAEAFQACVDASNDDNVR